MAMRGLFGTMEEGAWKWPQSDDVVDSIESPTSSQRLPAKNHNLADRNPAGNKRKAGRVDLSENWSESDVKKTRTEPKIKLEPGEENNTRWNFAGVVDLTLDSSDDEIAVATVNKPAQKPVCHNAAAPKVQPPRSETVGSSADRDRRMGGDSPTAIPVVQAKIPSTAPSSFSHCATDEDTKPYLDPNPLPRYKRIVKTGPFNLDSDSSDDEAEPAHAITFPVGKSPPHLAPKSPSPFHVLEVKLTQEEKAAQRTLAAEAREATRAKKAAEALKASLAPETPPPSAQRSTMEPTAGNGPLPAKKPTGPAQIVPGRKKEPGRISSSNTTDHAGLATSTSTKRPPSAGTSQDSDNQPISRLQQAILKKALTSGPKTQILQAPISVTAKQNGTKHAVFSRPREVTFTQQPSMAANLAKSHVEKLGGKSSSLVSPLKSADRGGLSREQNEELFGDDDLVIEEENAATKPKPKQSTNLAAQESSVARAIKQDAAHKAVLAQQLSEAEKAAVRADEQRRRIEAKKARNDQRKANEALEKQRESEERSRQAIKKRLEREAKDLHDAEQRKASHAKLEEVNRRKIAEDAERKRKNAEAREKVRQQQKQDQIRKQQARNARMEEDAELEAATREEDLGELILEGESAGDLESRDAPTTPVIPGGPISLNSATGTNLVKQTIIQNKAVKPLTVQQRIHQETQTWNTARNGPAKDAAKTPARNGQQEVPPFFTPHPTARKQLQGPTTAHSSGGSTPAREEKNKAHGRRLFPILPEDAEILKWRDQEDMTWDDIKTRFEAFAGKKLAATTLRKRYRQVQEAVKKAKVPFHLMQSLADRNEDAQDEVTLLMEEAGLDQVVAGGSSKLPLMGGGPVKLPTLGGHANGSSMWQAPTLDLERRDHVGVHPPRSANTIHLDRRENIAVREPRSSLATLVAPQDRPTTGGKTLNAEFYENILKARFEEDAGGFDADSETKEVEGDQFADFEPEDLLDYGFQVQRRELSTEAAEEGFPIENEPWVPCEEVFTDPEEANAAANVEILTILPGRPFYANKKSGFSLSCYEDPATELAICRLVNPIEGEVQTRVVKVLQTPRARMEPPTREEKKRELENRHLWHVHRRLTIENPTADDDLFGEGAPAARVVDVGKTFTYSDPDLANKRAAQEFVDYTFKSTSLSLDTRSEERKARVEGYLGGILVGKMFEGEMEISRDMERSTEVWTKFGIDEYNRSRVVLSVWIEDGVLFGPKNF